MTRFAQLGVLAVIAVAGLLVGCEQKPMSMDEMMAPPPRPAELDRLSRLVGTWKGTGTMTAAGSDETVQMTGSNTVSWACDKRVLLEKYSSKMGEREFEGIGVWTWDPRGKKYRVWWFDSFGAASEGTVEFDEGSDSFTFYGKSKNPQTGATMVGEGKVHFVSPDVIEWTHTEWNAWKTKKLMEFKGTSRRQ